MTDRRGEEERGLRPGSSEDQSVSPSATVRASVGLGVTRDKCDGGCLHSDRTRITFLNEYFLS